MKNIKELTVYLTRKYNVNSLSRLWCKYKRCEKVCRCFLISILLTYNKLENFNT